MKKLSDQHVKKHIASMAAEIIIEEGVSDYLYAKKKAAKHLNYTSYQTLPSNNEIDEAIREYQATFPADNTEDFIFYKEIEYFLLSYNYQFKTKDPKRLDSFLIRYILFYENIETELTVFDILEPRHRDKHKSMIKGRGIKIDDFKNVESMRTVS